jgi:hypothetical protein
MARRFSEAGVRFVQVTHRYWDSHGNLKKEHEKLSAEMDKPVAGLIKDLKQRGLLDETLSFGVANSDAPPLPRETTAAITIRTASPYSWPEAESKRERFTAQPTTTATTPVATSDSPMSPGKLFKESSRNQFINVVAQEAKREHLAISLMPPGIINTLE